MPDAIARAAEYQRARRLVEAQHVDDGVLGITGRDPDRAVLDIGVTAFVAGDLDPERPLLILLGQRDDAARERRREHQGATRVRRGLEDELHVLAKAEIEHLVGLVEHDHLQFGDVETAASSRCSRRGSMPPTQETTRPLACSYSQASSRWTCKASSRVGATIRASGAPARSNRSASPNRSLAMAS